LKSCVTVSHHEIRGRQHALGKTLGIQYPNLAIEASCHERQQAELIALRGFCGYLEEELPHIKQHDIANEVDSPLPDRFSFRNSAAQST
jgi:hypothetical protein